MKIRKSRKKSKKKHECNCNETGSCSTKKDGEHHSCSSEAKDESLMNGLVDLEDIGAMLTKNKV